MIDAKTREFLERTVREHFTPGNLNAVLQTLKDQVEEAKGDKKLVMEAFIMGIKKVLGRV